MFETMISLLLGQLLFNTITQRSIEYQCTSPNFWSEINICVQFHYVEWGFTFLAEWEMFKMPNIVDKIDGMKTSIFRRKAHGALRETLTKVLHSRLLISPNLSRTCLKPVERLGNCSGMVAETIV